MAITWRKVNPMLVLTLLAVGALGYIAGHRRVSSPAETRDFGGRARLVSSSGLLLEYPLGWEQAQVPSTIPGLAVTTPLTLQPHGRPAVGLLSGLLPVNEPAPLPAAFLATLKKPPRTEVVGLVTTQAFRYSEMQLPGYKDAFDLYVIPNAGGGPRVLACYAPSTTTTGPPGGTDRECEQIVQQATLIGPSASSLTPEPAYADKLASILTVLDSARVRVRRQMSASSVPATVGTVAEPLTKAFESAAGSLKGLEPPQVAAAAQGVLAQSVQRAAVAYKALSLAAQAESVGGYDGARERVTAAEAAVDSALRNFGLLGYGRH